MNLLISIFAYLILFVLPISPHVLILVKKFKGEKIQLRLIPKIGLVALFMFWVLSIIMQFYIMAPKN